jgi:hypothetical protein
MEELVNFLNQKGMSYDEARVMFSYLTTEERATVLALLQATESPFAARLEKDTPLLKAEEDAIMMKRLAADLRTYMIKEGIPPVDELPDDIRAEMDAIKNSGNNAPDLGDTNNNNTGNQDNGPDGIKGLDQDDEVKQMEDEHGRR